MLSLHTRCKKAITYMAEQIYYFTQASLIYNSKGIGARQANCNLRPIGMNYYQSLLRDFGLE